MMHNIIGVLARIVKLKFDHFPHARFNEILA